MPAQRGAAEANMVIDLATTVRPGQRDYPFNAALDRMLADAQAGKIDVVLVWKVDRLGRSLQHVHGVQYAITSQGVGFLSLRNAGLGSTTPARRLTTAIIAVFAAFEHDINQERVMTGVRRAQGAGEHCGGPRKAKAEKPLGAAKRLLCRGWAWLAGSKATGTQTYTLRRRLRDAGMLAQNRHPTGTP